MAADPLALRRLGRPAFTEWLYCCWGRGFAHGHELALAISGVDNVREADMTLAAAVEQGLIISTGCAPTRQQKFFGIGGLWWTEKARESWAKHPSTHGYGPGPHAGVWLEVTLGWELP